MINLIMIAISAIMFALLLLWWRWPAFRTWIEAPKYFMLRQERRFEDAVSPWPRIDSSKVSEPTKPI